MTITGTAAAQSTAGMFPETGAMSIQDIMLMLQARLDDADTQIRQTMANLANSTRNAKDMQERIAGLQQLMSELDEDIDSDEGIAVTDLTIEQQQALGRAGFETDGTTISIGLPVSSDGSGVMGPGFSVRSETREVEIPATVTKEQIQRRIDALTTDLNKLNSGNEMQMIQMQSVISQRANEIGLATNAIRAINESFSQIIQNIGR